MTTSLVIAPASGSVGGGVTVTLVHGIQKITGYATGTYEGFAWLGIRESRPQNPWGKIQVAGVDGDFAKFWGRTSRLFTIKGVIAVRQATIAATYPLFEARLDTLEQLNEKQFEWTITGPRTIGPGVIDLVDTDFLGPNTGGNLFFTLTFATLQG